MAAVRSLRVSLPPHSGSECSDSESDRDPREAEPMEVEEGELEPEPGPGPGPGPEDVSVKRSLKELLPDTSRRYENKAGAFITGIDVNSKEAIEKKEKRAQRFHFQAEESAPQRNVCLDKDSIKKAIPLVRLEALHMSGVDDMSTQDVFGYFREYPPAHIEWIDDTSCNVVWLDEDTCVRALVNTSRMPRPSDTVPADQTDAADDQSESSKGCRGQRSDDDDEEEDEEEGEVEEKKETTETVTEGQLQDLSGAEVESLMRNDLRPALKPFKGNKLLLRFATHDDKKEPGAARRSRYYMKYGNPNYGGMKGILSNSWKRRYHNRRIQRDVLKSKKPLIGDSLGHTPPYPHRHSAELVNLPEEPIKEEEEDEDEDMDSDDRVVEYRERGERERSARGAAHSRSPSSGSSSGSDDMDYDLELKMISTPSPKKSKKMTMYADELDSRLKSIRNRLGGAAPQRKPSPPPKVTDVRQLLEEKRQGQRREHPPQASTGKTDVHHRLGKRRRSTSPRSPSPPRDPPPEREPIRDVHRRLGVAKDRKTGGLWSRLGSSDDDSAPVRRAAFSTSTRAATEKRKPRAHRRDTEEEEEEEEEQEEDSQLQRVWGAMIKKKQSSHKNVKKSRLDNLPSLQIEISRDSTDESDN
ncbi:nuclear cap-binding protein subunit 3 isoform X2 [Periophthalmus magnuspinnatus]|uniref:nuclear cap-binding protein subunit 3 isoform X2 n=1 Tax=Periophthalmus magnuspinnatus TaxID=409849 RepID=UPI002436B1A7|nr:nuclear cap-binding protein subunit 3 isoform X2 [Periophthalmus magnuspinnatus]